MSAQRLIALIVAVAAVVTVAGCAAPRRPAPVIDRTTSTKPVTPAPVSQPVMPLADRPETYTIKRGDTLYSIALDHGLDYRELAEWNSIANPDLIREGQVLRTRPSARGGVQVSPVASAGSVQGRPLSAATKPDPASLKTEPRAVRLPYSEENLALLTRPSAKPEPQPQLASVPPPSSAALPSRPEAPLAKPVQADGDDEGLEWSWPAAGRLLSRFSESANKGVDIAGRKGEPVYASAGGRVVYSGEGLRGYGKLIIVKHNNTYLSAYGHNDSILVKEGQAVVKGQKIGEIGSTGTDKVKLHFEIRRMGKPVDPLKFLPEKPS